MGNDREFVGIKSENLTVGDGFRFGCGFMIASIVFSMTVVGVGVLASFIFGLSLLSFAGMQ